MTPKFFTPEFFTFNHWHDLLSLSVFLFLFVVCLIFAISGYLAKRFNPLVSAAWTFSASAGYFYAQKTWHILPTGTVWPPIGGFDPATFMTLVIFVGTLTLFFSRNLADS